MSKVKIDSQYSELFLGQQDQDEEAMVCKVVHSHGRIKINLEKYPVGAWMDYIQM